MNRYCISFTIITVAVLVSPLLGQNRSAEDQNSAAGAEFSKSELLIDKYLTEFKKSGVPTPGAVDAAFSAAEKANTLESWSAAARLANAYANIVGVLKNHYATLYDAGAARLSGRNDLLNTAVVYEQAQNSYLQRRNDAYLRIAKIYLSRGDKAQALSFAITAVQLSGAEPNLEAESLIKQVIEYRPAHR